MVRIVNLSNGDSWQNVYSTDISAVKVPLENGKYLMGRIAPIQVPILFSNHILAVNVETEIPEDAEWQYAGRVIQKTSTGLVIGGTQDAVMVRRYPLWLENVNLLLFERISATYSISIRVPKWFPRAIISVWEYIGVDDDSLAISNAAEFANINFKLDQLLSK